MAKKVNPKLLTKLELAVMRVVWEGAPDPLTVREVTERLNLTRSEPLAYTTVQTIMRILCDKGVLKTKAGPGRAHAFFARASRQEVTSSMVGDLVDRLFDGYAEPLLQHLLDHRSVNGKELFDLKKLIDRHLDDRESVP